MAETSEVSGDLAAARRLMVKEQLEGPDRRIKNPRVLAAMARVPRHEFVPEAYRAEAYADHPLPIGFGQTISQPFIVARMTELLDPQPTDRILEIGCGSGYQVAVLSTIVTQVFSIEIIEPLAKRAAETLKRLDFRNVQVKAGDGYLGWPEQAPFDAIIVTCAPDHVPLPLIEQLRDGGKMVIPVGESPSQELYLLEKKGKSITKRSVLPVRFVPMTRSRQ